MVNNDQEKGAESSSTSLDLDENIAAYLTYMCPPISGIIFLIIEEKSDLVRFHAMQSTLYTVIAFGFWLILFFIGLIISILTMGLGALIVVPVLLLIFFPMLGYLIYVMYQAYQGKRYRIPVIADQSDKLLS
ncbi:MAG: DUF4870 domain-containing protein [bacterium]